MHLFCQVSNFLGIFPVIYCIQYKAYGIAAVLSIAFVLSIIYHINESNRVFLLADMVGCSLLVAAGALIIKNSKYVLTFSNLMTILYSSAGLTCFVLAGDDTQSEDYKVFHTAWHVFSMYGIATFLYSYFNTTLVEREESRSKILCKPVKHLVVRVRRRGRDCKPEAASTLVLRKSTDKSAINIIKSRV